MSYSIGIDYGTASGRVILVDTSNGDIISSYEETYPHSTIAESLYGKRYHVIIFYKMLMIISTYLKMGLRMY